ncbi:MAG: sulfatase-like hydrolase/transferase [Flavobacteriales bacterium]|nr:sulfatase-like hydrolase/transferase [Flavobacteriales bacterium]MCB9335162.1 sulfatase-like hydrolase/transferase [Flavobacteriales bacterium]
MEVKHLSDIPGNERTSLIFQAFVMGFRFDTVISCYLLALPTFLILVFYQLKIHSKIFITILKYYLILVFSIAFLISGIDLTYFHHFFSRFSVAGLQWADDTTFMFSMIFQEFDFWWVIFPIIIAIFLFIKIVTRIFIKWQESVSKQKSESFNRTSSILISVLVLGIVFLGIRGRFESKSPIRVGTAYFSNYAFINQAGLNPVFTFLRSYLDAQKNKEQTIHILDNQIAIQNTQNYLNTNGIDSISPIARQITPDSINQNPPNVVLVIMESMSANKMGRYGNPDNLTPFLDSIANQGICFDNIYSAGTHTFNGIYSTIFSMPALFTKHPMKGVEIPKLNGIGTVLKQHGYSTSYFTTHDDQFDNVGGFLKGNDFELIISQQNYPSEKVESTLGVPDDYMFEFAINEINQLHQKQKPFLSVMMTASDHGPYTIPEYFTPKQPDDVKKQIVEYADWSIRKFIDLAKKQTWFENTIFAFIADHGAFMDADYDVPLSYNHVPFIIYAPQLITQHQQLQNYGGQIDVFPTLMHLVGLPYINNTLGIDLLNGNRPFMYFCNDDKMGVINKEYYYIYRKTSAASLYRYKENDRKDYIDFTEQAERMKTYGISNMQMGQYLIKNK